MRIQAVSPLSRAAVGILPPRGRPRASAAVSVCGRKVQSGDHPPDLYATLVAQGDSSVAPHENVGTGTNRYKNVACIPDRLAVRNRGHRSATQVGPAERNRGANRDPTESSVSPFCPTIPSCRLSALPAAAKSRFVAVAANEARTDLRSLSALSDVGRVLAGGLELRASLERALEKIEQHRGTVRGAVFLVDDSTGEIGVEA